MAKIFSCVLLPLFLSIHPYYVSMTEVNYNASGRQWEVSVRIFADDLEKAIRRSYRGKVDLLNEKEKKTSEALIRDYLQQHLSLRAGGKPVPLRFDGFESREGSIWSYLEGDAGTAPDALEVRNSILYDYQPLQTNFIRCKLAGEDETRKLNYPDSVLALRVKP